MLYLLESGRALYLLAVVCILGIVTRLTARNGYQRLQKECTNMTLTKNHNLSVLKQQAENTYRMNQGNMNANVFVENQMYAFRHRGIPIQGWTAISRQLTWLCLLLGGVGAFYSYWYRLDSYYIVLYATGGILLGMLTILPDLGIGPEARRQQLLVSLTDYIDHAMVTRLSRSLSDDSGKESVPENGSSRRPPAREKSRRDIDYLKRSLEQIAASREKSRAENEDWIKELGPKEVELLGEILKEYLA